MKKEHHLFKHGHRPKAGCSKTYKSWVSMRHRCADARNENYHGKGIEVCERWGDFNNFLADMGERPDGTTIDRIDYSKGYFPENCRWASSKTQARNKSTSLIVEFKGNLVNLVDLADASGIARTTIYRRYWQGLRGEELASPENRNKGKAKIKKTLQRINARQQQGPL